jgi:hydroxyacylglutathione hydrolase
MFFKQYYLGCLSHASYMVADEASRRAVVVDPQRDIEGYLRDAQARGLTIEYVVLTHFHADFVAGHLDLRQATGAHIVMGARAQADFALQTVADGESLDLGEVRLQVLETPGHTPEGISLLVFDTSQSATVPHAVLTGDTLFIGDVGRPDLLASIGCTADALAEMLYHSVRRLAELPDATLVYPAHGAGSMCGKNLSKDTVSTIGAQKAANYALQPMSLEEFKRLVTSEQPLAPGYFSYDAIKNRREHEVMALVAEHALRPLSLEEVLAQVTQGALILDVRDASAYASKHLRGSVHVGLAGQFATWCGTVVPPDTPLVVVADKGAEVEAVTRLGRIGYDSVVGYLAGGVEAATARPELLSSFGRLTPDELQARLRPDGEAAGPGTSPEPLVLDVRTPSEHAAGHLTSSVHIPLNQLVGRLAELPTTREIVVHCQGGYRSAIAVSLLERAGFGPLADLLGGYKAWEADGGPSIGTAQAQACSAS